MGGWSLEVELTTKNVVALATDNSDFGHVPAESEVLRGIRGQTFDGIT